MATVEDQELKVVHRDDYRAVLVGISGGSVVIGSAYPEDADDEDTDFDSVVEIDPDALDSVIAALIALKAKLDQ